MASFELSAFDRRFQAISLVGAIEQQSPYSLNVGFWIRDPNQLIQWPELVSAHPRVDYLWEHTCLEVFIGVIVKLISPLHKLGRLTNLKNIAIQKTCRHKLLTILN